MHKIPARKCQVLPISEKEGNAFLKEHHRSGTVKAKGEVYLGLHHNDSLVGVALFGNPRTKRKQKLYSKELLRLAFPASIQVQGGASKLVKHYMKNFQPYSLFTYQDTTGKVTSVYEHCGMTLVEEGKKKQYLVAPGKTLKTANRRECFGVPYVVQYGPDRILGTKLGEVWENGRRLTNVELFLSFGWHLEETIGDRVYAWENPNYTFYIYKIVSSADEGYYVGRRGVRKSSLTVEECLADKYMGSGGVKFSNWVAKVGEASLSKEILAIVDEWNKAVQAEAELIGKAYSSDPNCKNSQPGGTGSQASSWGELFSTKNCPAHGLTKFFAEVCCSCRNQRLVQQKECEIHGVSTHQGETCSKCSSEKAISTQLCAVHGRSKFTGGRCYKCFLEKLWTEGECAIHGTTLFQSGACLKCRAAASFTLKNCPLHGEVKHRGGLCYKCHTAASVREKTCPAHGLGHFRGDVCSKCRAGKKDREDFCPHHGLTSFQYSKCKKCLAEERDLLKVCSVHGLTKFRGSSCYRCTLEKANREDICGIHGTTKFRGKTCCKCATIKATHTRYHGKMQVIVEGCSYCEEDK